MCDHARCNEATVRTKRVLDNILKGVVEEQDRDKLHLLVTEAIAILGNVPSQVWAGLASGEVRAIRAGGVGLGDLLGAILQVGQSESPEDSMLKDGVPANWPGKGSVKGN